MSGRPQKTKLDRLEDKIRTIAWFKFVLTASQTKNANQFSEIFLDKTQRKWSNYSKGQSTPTGKTLKIIESMLPGSLDIFENGVEDSYLFRAMFDHIDDITNLFGSENDRFCWLTTVIIPGTELWQIDDASLEAILIGLENTLIEDVVFQENYNTLCPASYTDFFTCCVILLRFTIDRDKYHSYSYVIKYLDLIFNCIEHKDILNLLDFYGIKYHFLEWLHYSLNIWITYSRTGSIFVFSGDFPSLKEFKKKPRIFLDNYKKSQVICELLYGDESISQEQNDMLKIKRLKKT